MNYVNRKNVTMCAVCSTIRGEANHWHQIYAARGATARHEDGTETKGGFEVLFIGANAADYAPTHSEVFEVCGENHLHQQIDRLRGLVPDGGVE